MSAAPVYVDHFRVTFDEADPAGIAFFGKAFTYAHRAYEAYVRSLGFDDFFSAREFIVPFVHSECSHRAPLRLGDELRTEVYLERLGESSLTFRYLITDGVKPRAEVKLVSVFVDAETFGKIPIPNKIREALAD